MSIRFIFHLMFFSMIAFAPCMQAAQRRTSSAVIPSNTTNSSMRSRLPVIMGALAILPMLEADSMSATESENGISLDGFMQVPKEALKPISQVESIKNRSRFCCCLFLTTCVPLANAIRFEDHYQQSASMQEWACSSACGLLLGLGWVVYQECWGDYSQYKCLRMQIEAAHKAKRLREVIQENLNNRFI